VENVFERFVPRLGSQCEFRRTVQSGVGLRGSDSRTTATATTVANGATTSTYYVFVYVFSCMNLFRSLPFIFSVYLFHIEMYSADSYDLEHVLCVIVVCMFVFVFKAGC
jgi:hypothetical protein